MGDVVGIGDHVLYNGDCAEVMRDFEEASIDLIITSPPYWNQEDYSFWPSYRNYTQDVRLWVEQCFRVLKPGRHCFWVIPDKLPWPPKENGTKERLYMPIYSDTERVASEWGFVCEFPIVWDKRGPDLTMKPWGKKMWGSYPYPVSIIHTPFTERICVWRKPGSHGLTKADREDSKLEVFHLNEWSWDVWNIKISTDREHPAPFPMEIPIRVLTLWSCIGDTILDPFMGGATTGLACQDLDRKFIGIEKNTKFFNLSVNRMDTLFR